MVGFQWSISLEASTLAVTEEAMDHHTPLSLEFPLTGFQPSSETAISHQENIIRLEDLQTLIFVEQTSKLHNIMFYNFIEYLIIKKKIKEQKKKGKQKVIQLKVLRA